MPQFSDDRTLADLGDRICAAVAASPEFVADVIRVACRRFPLMGRSGKSAHVKQLIESEAWTDAALALVDLELPQWQLRRLVYDEGEWHCALSRERELPDWLDQSVESRHADLALAILGAFVDARRIATTASRTSVPLVNNVNALYESVCCDNFD